MRIFLGNKVKPNPMITLSYGPDAAQTFDVYRASKPNGFVIFMVHGGGWRRGDNRADGVITNKLAYWGAKGYTIVSTDYRVLPTTPDVQAADVAAALAMAQRNARDWKCDPDKFILMGHSAGAHLVALINADNRIPQAAHCHPWLCTVELDSAAYDVPAIMNSPFHDSLYDDAFGSDPDFWVLCSPIDQLNVKIAPMMLVYSSQRGPMDQNNVEAFATKLEKLNSKHKVYPVDLTHGQIDSQLGVESAYTTAVDQFIRKYTRRP